VSVLHRRLEKASKRLAIGAPARAVALARAALERGQLVRQLVHIQPHRVAKNAKKRGFGVAILGLVTAAHVAPPARRATVAVLGERASSDGETLRCQLGLRGPTEGA
jgi:hypothetical protein